MTALARRPLPLMATVSSPLALSLSVVASQTPAPAQKETARISRDVKLSAASIWTTTDIELQPGERAVFTATGTGRCGPESEFGPAGLPRGFRDLLRVLPVQSGRGALIGRVGDADVGLPFMIGASGETAETGRVNLARGIKCAENDPCTPAFTVHVYVFPPRGEANTLVAKRVDALNGVDEALLAKLPRRVRDRQGNAGDMVNFLILGSDAAMQRAFKNAGWVTVDADAVGAVITGVLGSLSKEAYLTRPLSQLCRSAWPREV